VVLDRAILDGVEVLWVGQCSPAYASGNIPPPTKPPKERVLVPFTSNLFAQETFTSNLFAQETFTSDLFAQETFTSDQFTQ
jgi:hypothetical protein